MIWLSIEKKKNCPDFPPSAWDNFYIDYLLCLGLRKLAILANPSLFIRVLNTLGQYDVISTSNTLRVVREISEKSLNIS